MTDEFFLKMTKKAIAEHFNSHCKVGGMFEDSIKTTEDFIKVVWYHRGNRSNEKQAFFQVTSSHRFGVYYHAHMITYNDEQGEIILSALNTIDYKGLYFSGNELSYTKPGQKMSEAEIRISKDMEKFSLSKGEFNNDR